jgi:hypothetical protein
MSVTALMRRAFCVSTDLTIRPAVLSWRSRATPTREDAMRLRHILTLLGSFAALGTLPGCKIATSADDTSAGLQVLDIGICAPTQGGFSATSTNPYFPFQTGSQWIYDGEEDGVAIHLEITALNKHENVGGVTTQVIEERETANGELSEVSRNFFAQTSDGTVCYFGEEVDIYEGGKIVGHEGEWRGDQPGNAPGIIMPASPKPGMKFQFESAPGVAEDQGSIVGTGPADVPAGRFTETIGIREFNPLDGGRDFKVYAAGVGLIIDGTLQLTSYTP